MQNYIDGLEEMNFELADEFKAALKEKRQAMKKSEKSAQLADSRLQKWHNEQTARREAQDELVMYQRIANEAEKIMSKYKALIEESERTHLEMKTEWESEAAARRIGGGRRWPVWVIQLSSASY